MTNQSDAGASQPANPLFALIELSRQARQAATAAELRFLLVNDTHRLAAYRQGAFWLQDSGLQALSGVVAIEANAPYSQWLARVCDRLDRGHTAAAPVSAADLAPDLAADWAQWLPAHALWLPLKPAASSPEAAQRGGLLLARDLPWSVQETALLAEWSDIWAHAWQAQVHPPAWTPRRWLKRLRAALSPAPGQPWWRQRPLRWAALLAAVLLLPVRLTVLAPGELVPAHPVVIRAPLDGVVDAFHVQPNERVSKGQPLFGFDEALISSRLEVAQQNLQTAETEYRQVAQQALQDAKYRHQLALLTGKIEEKRAEADFQREQLQRSQVSAPQDGIALFDDPSEWTGRPVTVGERIMRIADPGDSEVEAWLAIGDAIALEVGSEVTLYLNANPLSPLTAHLRYIAHDAVQRPDGSYAYRVRATLQQASPHRVGLKGTAKLSGGWTPLVYWLLRRPLAALRSAIGV